MYLVTISVAIPKNPNETLFWIFSPRNSQAFLSFGGVGKETVWRLVDGANCNMIEPKHSDMYADHDIYLHDFTMIGNKANQQGEYDGISCPNILRWEFDNLYIRDFGAWAIDNRSLR